jgi:hypothetical protein
MDKAYSIFLTIQLAIANNLMDKDLEYDVMWANGVELYEKFKSSSFNDDNISEYQGIDNYLKASIDDVIFLWEDCLDADVFAYFPNTIFDARKNKTSYSHIGQHSACSEEYARGCKLATPKEYKDLKNELERMGYVLNVLPEFVW